MMDWLKILILQTLMYLKEHNIEPQEEGEIIQYPSRMDLLLAIIKRKHKLDDIRYDYEIYSDRVIISGRKGSHRGSAKFTAEELDNFFTKD